LDRPVFGSAFEKQYPNIARRGAWAYPEGDGRDRKSKGFAERAFEIPPARRGQESASA
jgi:hypothetical protein